MEIILTALLILVLRIGQDTLFLAKIDAFNRNNKYYSMTINFLEAMYGITVIKIILDLMQKSPWYVLIFGAGSMLGGLLVSHIKIKLDRRLQGQRQYFVRISLDDDKDRSDLIRVLKENEYEFTMANREYLNGRTKLIIEGSLENRKRMIDLKNILRGRPGKHVTIFRADEIYFLK